MAKLKLDAQLRELTGRKVRKLRNQGLVPIVIYGDVEEPENAQVDETSLERVLKAGGSSQLVEVDLEGAGERNVLVRDVQRHPVRRSLIHADFYAVNMQVKQQVSIPVYSVGQPAAETPELVLVQALDHVEIEALPADIPARIDVDVTRLETPDSDPISVSELPELPGVVYLTPPDEPIFSLVYTRVVEEEEEEELLEEAMMVEPEVIGRGKEEEEEEMMMEEEEEE